MEYNLSDLQPQLTKVDFTKFSGPNAVKPKKDIFIIILFFNFYI